jgi:hypothetical protein
MVRHIPFPSIDDVFDGIMNGSRGPRVLDILFILEARSKKSVLLLKAGILNNLGIGIQSIHFLFVGIGDG